MSVNMDMTLLSGRKLFFIAAAAVKPIHFPSSICPVTFPF